MSLKLLFWVVQALRTYGSQLVDLLPPVCLNSNTDENIYNRLATSTQSLELKLCK